MNHAEIVDLLTACAAYDRRTVGESDVHAWHKALHDMPIEHALAAVPEWFGKRTNDAWTMPHHIRNTWNDMHRAQVEREHSQRILDDAHALPAPGGEDPHRATGALHITCPVCDAPTGTRCTWPDGTPRRTPCLQRITNATAEASHGASTS